MRAHTPEPWSFSTEPQPNGCPIIGARGLMIAMLAHTINQEDQKETAVANARLIAAAPDLLAALSDLLYYSDDVSSPKLYSNAADAARAAIAKATGAAE